MKISIIGTGYIGLIQALGLKSMGFSITSVDINKNIIDRLKSGESTIYEEGLDELMAKYHKNINWTTDIQDVEGSQIIFICVGTPQSGSGITDLGYIYGAIKDIKPYLSRDTIIVIKSTVPIGTNAKLYRALGSTNEIVSNPEFLREGKAIYDFFNPSRIIYGFRGEIDDDTINKVKYIYKDFKGVPELVTNWESRELIKYASNSFLATKISFVNEIARLADISGADIKDITLGMGFDSRIGDQFLNAGIGYGGSCFPKDVKSLIYQFHENLIEPELIKNTDLVNETQVDYFYNKILKHFDGDIHSKKIGLVGVAFKPGTDDLRESRGLILSKMFMKSGARLKVFDYNSKALDNFERYIDGVMLEKSRGYYNINISRDFSELVQDLDFLVVALEDKSILNEDFDNIKLGDNIIFDGRNILNRDQIKALGIKYVGVGYN